MSSSSIIPIGQPVAAKRPAPDAALAAAVAEKSALVMARLNTIIDRHPNVVFANSLGAEDMVLVDMICKDNLPIGIFTLDTGRLNEETYALLAQVQKHYPNCS
ncbi:MAG: phosphoadenosine phosphosulfate reductase family protein, partial [Fluviibacter sp.]